MTKLRVGSCHTTPRGEESVERPQGDFGMFRVFADHPESPFFRADRRTPEETWDEICDCGASAINDVRSRIRADKQPVEPGLIRHWHHVIFESTFPRDAGRFRGKLEDGSWEEVFFGVAVGTARTQRVRPVKGAHPNRIEPQLGQICDQFNSHAEETLEAGVTTLRASSTACARLYARVLNVHPFIDGNLRAAFTTLQFALQTLDLPMVEFPNIEEHNAALDTALRVDSNQSYDPLGTLIAAIIGSSA
jgi:fido (protein-threonine AMPylation protein)